MTEQELKAIEEREQAASKGPWQWQRCYETGHSRLHWGLVSPSSEAEGRVATFGLILHHRGADLFGKPTEQDPDLQFVAHARSDIPSLLSFVRFLQAMIHDLTEESAAYNRGREDEEKRWREYITERRDMAAGAAKDQAISPVSRQIMQTAQATLTELLKKMDQKKMRQEEEK